MAQSNESLPNLNQILRSEHLLTHYVLTRSEKHLVEAVYCTGIKYGTYKDWISMFNKSINSIPAEQIIIWQSLVCNRDTWILKGLLEMTLHENVIKRSELRRIFSYFGLSSISRSVYFEFINKNWNDLLKK